MSRILDFNDGFTSVNEPTPSGHSTSVHDIVVDQAANTVMTLLDSGNYIVGIEQLTIYLNGLLLQLGVDYSEIGTPGSLSTQILMIDNLVAGDKLTIRK